MEMKELDITLDPREEKVIKFDFNATLVQITNLEKDIIIGCRFQTSQRTMNEAMEKLQQEIH